MTELIAAAIGAVLGYAGGWLKQGIERRRERISLATAMLQELRALDVTMRDLYVKKNLGRLPASAFPLLRYQKEALRLFKPDTVRELLEVTGLVDMVIEIQDKVHEGVLDPRKGTWLIVRANVYAAVQRIPKLKAALEQEGAHPPVWEPVRAPDGLDRPEPPKLPESPFPSVKDSERQISGG